MLKEASVQFESTIDLSNGGVLFALPALLSNGLLKYINQFFYLSQGFYGLSSIFTLLSFMALCRVKNIEQLRYSPVGEWGKLLGLDRIPEVRTLRYKVNDIAEEGKVAQWGRKLAQDWMEEESELVGKFYIDGHVRIYSGQNTKLPRRYVSRQKLCLRGTTDYWVNNQTGLPFFRLSTPFNSGLLNVLRADIVPQLLEDFPNRPSQDELEADSKRALFMLIYDREAFSLDFFYQMWQMRIACQTYNKYPGKDWPVTDFQEYTIQLPWGQPVMVKLAERIIKMEEKGGEKWELREVRRLCQKEHQVSILTMDFKSDLTKISVQMSSRWYQENFFKYAMKHYNIDALVDYRLEDVDETKKVVNPQYRELDRSIKTKTGQLERKKAKFGGLVLSSQMGQEPPKDTDFGDKEKGILQKEMDVLQKELDQLKVERKKTAKHVTYKDLPEEEKFKQLSLPRKQLIDTIKMIAYRAETGMAGVLWDIMSRTDDARALLREIFTTEANLIPNLKEESLTVQLHLLSNPISNKIARQLCENLNETETNYPGTNLRMIFKLVSD